MSKTRLSLVGVAVAACLVLLGVMSSTIGAGTKPDMLAAADLKFLEITSATDVTDLAQVPLLTSGVSREKAIAAAQDEMGNSDDNVRVLQGRAIPFPKQPDRPVWIVLFRGGVSPFDGPAQDGRRPIAYGVTGVIVDAETGEVLRGFMH